MHVRGRPELPSFHKLKQGGSGVKGEHTLLVHYDFKKMSQNQRFQMTLLVGREWVSVL